LRSQFPRLDIGTYSVKFELAGFKTFVHPNVVDYGESSANQPSTKSATLSDDPTTGRSATASSTTT
jgi:hypothetical protein